jgi:hypothetical protein
MTNLTRSDIVTAILSGQWTRDDIEAFFSAAKSAWGMKGQQAKATFNVGDRVTFEFRGIRRCATITKIMQKNIKVRTDEGINVRVSPSLLAKVLAEKTVVTPAGTVQLKSLRPKGQ